MTLGNPNAQNLPLPSFTVSPNDFRDYSVYDDSRFKMKKQLRKTCNWRCTAFILMALVAVLVILMAYFAGEYAFFLSKW